MPSRAQNIVCAGVAVLDQIFRIDGFPAPETKIRANAFVTTLGGCAANAAVAIARLGGRVSLAAPLGGPQGQDMIGDRIVEELARNGVDHSACMRIASVASPLSAILVDASGARTIITHRDTRLRAVQPNNPAALVASAALLLVDNRIPDF